MKDMKSKTLCEIAKKTNIKKKIENYAELVKDPGYVCVKCGRAAADKGNLCKPVKI
ncbi:MAG: hypothetical protein HQL30_10275 [Candidatus Omnitrophica bacterium]|nr:hypothetical protein [Candidatus Omnitrophota bacterium]